MEDTFLASPEKLLEQITRTPPTTYNKPHEIGCFSFDTERNLTLDRSQLKRYHHTPEICQHFGDLSHNYASFVEKQCRSHLYPILAVLNELPERPLVEVVTWRGVLTRIMSTSFDHKGEWSMYGTIRNNVLYIEEERLPSPNNSPRSKMCTYWGHKFENLCMVDHSLAPLDIRSLEQRREEPVNTNEEFGIVLKVKLGEHRFVIGAEVDGLDEEGKEYVELKTSKTPSNNFEERYFKEKLMKFWLQSYLAGIPKVLVGFRDKRGFVKSLEYYQVSQIPRLVRGHVQWDPNAVLLMGDQFFTWLKARIAADKITHGEEFSFRLRHGRDGGGVIEYGVTHDLSADLPDWYKYY